MAVAHASYLAASSVSTLDDVDRLSRDRSLGLSYEALLSILARRVDTDLKRDIGHHRKAEVAAQHVRKYLRGDSLLTIAASAGLPPTMLARVVLETHLNLKRGKEVGQLLKSPQLIDDARLRREVERCVESDPFCGPNVDNARRLAGLEYELLLSQKLVSLGVPFLTEDQLRLRGDAKTPDALLPVPLLVRGNRIVHWIDSKATFGDPASHDEYRTNQFASYLHRFGPGLVIYWHGYDESIDTDPRILLLSDLRAEECEQCSCLPVGASSGAFGLADAAQQQYAQQAGAPAGAAPVEVG